MSLSPYVPENTFLDLLIPLASLKVVYFFQTLCRKIGSEEIFLQIVTVNLLNIFIFLTFRPNKAGLVSFSVEIVIVYNDMTLQIHFL